MDRYNHDLGGEDTDDTDDTPVFGSFSSYTPQYRKQHYSWSRTTSASSTTSVASSTSQNYPSASAAAAPTTTTVQNATTTTSGTITTTATAVSASSTQETQKLLVTESSSSPTNTVDSVAKCRKISAPLAAAGGAGNSITTISTLNQHMVNKVLTTPQLRKIEVIWIFFLAKKIIYF